MATGVGEYLVASAHRRGIVVFVDVDKTLKYYPEKKMTQSFLRLLNAHYYHVLNFVLLDTIST